MHRARLMGRCDRWAAPGLLAWMVPIFLTLVPTGSAWCPTPHASSFMPVRGWSVPSVSACGRAGAACVLQMSVSGKDAGRRGGGGGRGGTGGGFEAEDRLPGHVKAELSKLSDDERSEILKAVGLGPSKKNTPKEGREKKKKVKAKETSAERRARRKRREEEEAGLVPKLAKGVRQEQQRKAAEAKARQEKERLETAGADGSQSFGYGEIFSDKNQADTGRDKDEEEEEEDDDEELWEDVDEDRMTERELAFFSDERLAGSGTENDSFLRSIFGETAGKGRGGGASSVEGGAIPEELRVLVDEKKAKSKASKEERNAERRRLVRDDGGGDRGRFHMVFPDETSIDPYDPQTFGYLQVGFVRGCHGVKGEVKVDSSRISDFPLDRLSKNKDIFVQMPGKRSPRPWVCLGSRPGSKEGMTIVQLKGVQTREMAMGLRGARLFVRDVDVESKNGAAGAVNGGASREADQVGGEGGGEGARGEYFVHELVGLKVVLPREDMRVLGHVVGVVTRDELTELTMKGQELIEVRFGDPEVEYVDDEKALRLLVPFVPAIVPLVDIQGKIMHMTPPGGLMDLAEAPPPRKVVIRGLLSEWGESASPVHQGR